MAASRLAAYRFERLENITRGKHTTGAIIRCTIDAIIRPKMVYCSGVNT